MATETLLPIPGTGKSLRGFDRGSSGVDEVVVLADGETGLAAEVLNNEPTSTAAGIVVRNVHRHISTENTSTTPIAAGQSFTGDWHSSSFPDVLVTARADQAGTLKVQFSQDAVNVDSIVTYNIDANTNEVHRLVVGARYIRVIFTNTSDTDQTYLRLMTVLDQFGPLTSALSSTLRPEADSVVVRPTIPELEIASGKWGRTVSVNKFGRNASIDTASVPEDICAQGGIYAGFPVHAGGSPFGYALDCEVFSSSASDTGLITVYGLKEPTSEIYTSETFRMTGTVPVNIGTWYRINRAIYDSGTNALNVGTITGRDKQTTANVFFQIVIGYGQTEIAGWTVPYNNTAYLFGIGVDVFKQQNAIITGAIWVRKFGSSPRLTRSFTASNSSQYQTNWRIPIQFEALTDLILRVTACTANGVTVSGQMDIVSVRA